MPTKANLRSEGSRVEIPAFPLIGAPRRPGPSNAARAIERAEGLMRNGDDSGARRALREAGDAALAANDPEQAAEILIELGTSLCSNQSFGAGIMVLHEAHDAARAAADPMLVARVRSILDREAIAARAD